MFPHPLALTPMPDFSNSATADLLLDATRLYTGLRDHAEIAAALEPFGYDRAAARDGLAAVAALRDALRAQGTEAAESDVADKASAAATATVRAAYVVHRARARRAHPRGSAGYTALHLAGDAPHAEAILLADARRLYETLLDQPDLARAARNLAPDTVSAALATVTAADTADDDQTREGGEAQRATALRDAAEAALRRAASALAADARDALSDAPQLREVLGLMQR